MQQPIQITFRDMDHSDPAEAYVRDLAEKLETFDGRIVACRVALEIPHRNRNGGQPRVRIDLTVPGDEIVVDYAPPEASHEDLYACIDQAFERMVRRLEDHARKRRGDVKRHTSSYREGQVAKLWSYDGFGFVATADGEEVYFHRNSVLGGGFDKLEIGAKVRFIEEMGDKGPQASTVILHA